MTLKLATLLAIAVTDNDSKPVYPYEIRMPAKDGEPVPYQFNRSKEQARRLRQEQKRRK